MLGYINLARYISNSTTRILTVSYRSQSDSVMALQLHYAYLSTQVQSDKEKMEICQVYQ